MKIGILTFHRADNYGAVLQSFALRNWLVNRGYSVEFIGYRQPKIEDAYKLFDVNILKRINVFQLPKFFLSRLISFRRRYRKKGNFKFFRQSYLPESVAYTKEQALSQVMDYDVVLFGSDQIWTTRFMGGFDDVFWGNIKLKSGKKIAYAPSMELASVTMEQIEYIKRNLLNFDSISARELALKNKLEEICLENCPVVLDPTLLCKSDVYEPWGTSKKIKGKYILVYQVGKYEIVEIIARKVSEVLNLPIIEIDSEVYLHTPKNHLDTVGPDEFVSLIKNAFFVVTSSFHGTAFSINLNIPFYSILIDGIDSRLKSVLNLTLLESRGIRCVTDVNKEFLFDINFDKSNKMLEILREQSEAYLLKALNQL